MKYLLDTNICIYVIKKQYVDIARKMEKAGIENIFVSTITIAELEYGIARSSKPRESESKLYEFLVPFTIIDFDVNAARYYGKIISQLTYKGTIIGAMDLLIAAIGLANECVVVTNNEKEFERVPNLKIQNWVR